MEPIGTLLDLDRLFLAQIDDIEPDSVYDEFRKHFNVCHLARIMIEQAYEMKRRRTERNSNERNASHPKPIVHLCTKTPGWPYRSFDKGATKSHEITCTKLRVHGLLDGKDTDGTAKRKKISKAETKRKPRTRGLKWEATTSSTILRSAPCTGPTTGCRQIESCMRWRDTQSIIVIRGLSYLMKVARRACQLQ